jgi:hypothetical protein
MNEDIMFLTDWYNISSVPAGFVARRIQIDGTHESPAESGGGFTNRAMCFDKDLVVKTQIPFGYFNVGPVTRSDLAHGDERGMDELLWVGGIVDTFHSQTEETFRSGTSSRMQDWYLPVSLDGNSYADIVASEPSRALLRVLVSNVALESISVGDPAIRDLRCAVVEGTGLAQIVVAASLPNPLTGYIDIDPGDGTSWATRDSTAVGQYTYDYQKSGSYTIRVRVGDTANPDNVVTSSCAVEVEIVDEEISQCTLDPDGEFNYNGESVAAHGWTGNNYVAAVNGHVILTGSQTIEYDVSACAQTTVTLSASLIPAAGATIMLKDAQGAAVASVKFDTGGVVKNGMGGPIDTWTSAGFVEVQIAVSAAAGQYVIYIDGTVVYVGESEFSGVASVALTGQGEFDYVRIVGSGITFVPGGGMTGDGGSSFTACGDTGDVTYLDACDPELSQSGNIDERTSYQNVWEYCASLESGACDYCQLRAVMIYNQDCTKEAMNYCVYVTYPDLLDAEPRAATYDGATVCSANLFATAMYAKIVEPSGSIIWYLITKNWPVVLIMVLLLVIIGAFMSRRK